MGTKKARVYELEKNNELSLGEKRLYHQIHIIFRSSLNVKIFVEGKCSLKKRSSKTIFPKKNEKI